MTRTYRYLLVLEDGRNADPPAFYSTEASWEAGDEIVAGGRTFEILARQDALRDVGAGSHATLVVRPL